MEWKKIDNSDNYFVNKTGEIKSKERITFNGKGYYLREEKILKQQISTKGYKCVTLLFDSGKKTLPVHRLVAKAFIINKENKPQVNHINGVKTDNRVNNLEWVDNSENQLHAYKLGLNKHYGTSGKEKKPVWKLDVNGNIIEEYDSISKAASENKLRSSNISLVCRKVRKSCGGFGWCFK